MKKMNSYEKKSSYDATRDLSQLGMKKKMLNHDEKKFFGEKRRYDGYSSVSHKMCLPVFA
jgi:hypothetical protein